jgi:cholesterol transport system auxiliary component
MRHAFRAFTLAAVMSLNSACSILPQAEPSDVYRLPSTQSTAPTPRTAALPWSLRLNKPKASEALDSPKIAVIPQGDLISSYKGVRWSDPAPVLLRNRMLDAFQRDGRVQLLSTDDSNLQADLELGGELQAFQSEYTAQGLQVVIRLDARLVRDSTQRILASRRFEVRQPVTGTQVPTVVAGFGQASDKLLAQVLEWAVTQGQLEVRAQVQPKNQ